jgi:hypothetical protein
MIRLKELFDTKEKIRWREGDDVDFTTTFTGPNNQKYVINITSLEYLTLPSSAIIAAGNLLPDEGKELAKAFRKQLKRSEKYADKLDIYFADTLDGMPPEKSANDLGLL